MSEKELHRLLIAYFDNTINETDCESLLAYIDHADEEYISAQIDLVSKNRTEGPNFDTLRANAVFAKILADERMEDQVNKLPLDKRSDKFSLLKTTWFKYAAIFTVIAGVGLLLIKNQNKFEKVTEQPATLVNTTVDSTKITFTTSGNETIVLDQKRGGMMEIVGSNAITTKNGELSYQKLTDSKSQNHGVVYNTLSIPVGAEYKIILEDGTKVWLNSASVLTFPTKFDQQNRIVSLSGEAYFEVAKDKNRPFKVNANGAEVKVLGTHFNISAHKDEEVVETTLLEGAVKVFNNGKDVLLAPSEQAISAANEVGSNVKKVNVDVVMAWKDGYFLFQDADIKSIMKDLKRWYDIDVVYSGKISTAKFGGTFSRSKDLKELLQHLESLGEIHFKVDGRRVIVTS